MTKSVFDHVNAIYTNQSSDYFDTLTDADKKAFSEWMINRIISMNPDYIEIVNEIQQYYSVIRGKDLYLFFAKLLPKKKQFNKYIKALKSQTHDEEATRLISTKYQVSLSEAQEYMDLFLSTESGTAALEELLTGFGVDQKALKRMLK